MYAHPEGIDRLHERLLLLVRDHFGGVPSCAPINHVENDVLVDEQQDALHLLVERIGHLNVAGVTGPRLGPFTANSARVDDLRDQIQYFLRDANPVEESLHSFGRSMPPTDMQLA